MRLTDNIKSKKILRSEVEQVISTDSNGEVVNEKHNITNTIQVVSTEPPYIKLYLDDISKLNELGKHDNSILHEILRITQYNTNLVTLNKFYREQICKKLKTTDATVRNVISKLNKKNILIKQGTGVYMLNPNLFGNGSWDKIKGLRMTIEYTEHGKKVEFNGIEDDEQEFSVNEI